MSIGVSTSCYYPLATELAFKKIASLNVKTCEIFFNSFSELEKPFLKEICKIRDDYGMRVPSVHPFLSFGEPYLLFSEYERRFLDTIEFYKKYFEAANFLGAKFLVMHGGKESKYVADDLFFERFAKLAQEGRKSGIIVAQENVVNYRGQSPDLLVNMKAFIGDDFKIVLDIKQAGRAGYSPFEFIEQLPGSIVHIHISDSNGQQDCMPPGEGSFDFVRLLAEMKAAGDEGDYIIELYRHNFEDDSQIVAAKHYMEHLERML
jgi:sugar phosphate isomerase/epimerase